MMVEKTKTCRIVRSQK